MNRNYNTISPSAKSLLLMKGLTNIPYARQAADILISQENYKPDYKKRDFNFWARVVHFENRYWSINQLLADLTVKNIIELSSGFSFRGLQTIKEDGFYYIDTDLPEVIDLKNIFIKTLRDNDNSEKSKLETIPLNALDEREFEKAANHFPGGKIVIVNEGLLMYLDNREKEILCRNIHKILKKHGGYWITADIYVKNKGMTDIIDDERQRKFFEQHNIEENKFESFEAAKLFFNKVGFEIEKEAVFDHTKLSSLKYLLENANKGDLEKLGKRDKIQATWRLKITS